MGQRLPRSPATKAEIATILRTRDADLIERIAATGASYTELVEAFLRATQEYQTDNDDCVPSHRVARAMTVLAVAWGASDHPDE